MTSETIEWNLVTPNRMPDDGETVLLAWDDAPVFVGFLDGDQWRQVDAMPCSPPMYWAALPEGPA